MSYKKDEWLNEPVSEDLKNRIFKQVQVELDYNKQLASNKTEDAPVSVWNLWKVLSFSTMALAIVGVFALRSMNIIDIDRPTTTFSELASLTPEEFEVIENLDFIDELDHVDLEKIRKEMKKRRGKYGES